MDLLLKILGTLLILIILLLIVGWIALKYLSRRWLKHLAAGSALPTEITLVENPDPEWTRERQVMIKCREFAELGYEATKVFLPTPQAIEMMFFTNPDRTRRGVIYKTVLGYNEEFEAQIQDGLNINVTNHELSNRFPKNPRKVIESMPGASIHELHRRYEELIRNQELVRVSDETLAHYVESQYKAGMVQSYESGGMPMWEDSFADFSATWQDKYEAGTLREAFTATVASQLAILSSEVSETLSQSSDITAKQWSTYKDNLILCNPRIDRSGFARFLIVQLRIGKLREMEVVDSISKAADDAQQILDQVAVRFPRFGIVKLTTIDQPIQAAVYGYESGYPDSMEASDSDATD